MSGNVRVGIFSMILIKMSLKRQGVMQKSPVDVGIKMSLLSKLKQKRVKRKHEFLPEENFFLCDFEYKTK